MKIRHIYLSSFGTSILIFIDGDETATSLIALKASNHSLRANDDISLSFRSGSLDSSQNKGKKCNISCLHTNIYNYGLHMSEEGDKSALYGNTDVRVF